MTIEIEAPDGSIVEFPDGTSDETIRQAMARAFPSRREGIRRQRPQGYNDAAGASATYAHGATFGYADEMVGLGAGAIEGARSFADPSRVTEERGGRLEDTGPLARPIQDLSQQSAIGALLDTSERTGRPIAPLPQPQQQPPANRFEAAIRGAQRGYNETAGRFRRDYEQFHAERPIVATGTEIMGAVLSPIGRRIGTGRLGGETLPLIGGRGIRQGIRQGALGGSLYAVGTGEDLSERTDLRRIGAGAGLGGLGGAAFGVGGRILGTVGGGGLNVATRFGLNPNQRAVRFIARAIGRQQATEDDLVRAGMPRQQARDLVTSGQAPFLRPEDVAGRARYVRNRNRGTKRNPAPTAIMNFEMLGEQGRAMANATANAKGPGRDIAAAAFSRRTTGSEGQVDPFATPASQRGASNGDASRPGTVTDRMLSASRRALPTHETRVPQTWDEFNDALAQGRANQGREGYVIGLAHDPEPVVVQQRIAPLINSMPKQARQAAARSGADQLEFELGGLRNELAQAGDDAQAVAALQERIARAQKGIAALRLIEAGKPTEPNIWALDYFQRGVQQFEAGLARGSPEARVVGNMRRLYIQNLREAAPAWGEAHDNYGASMRVTDLAEQARGILRSPESLDEVMQMLRGENLNIHERDAIVVGVLRALDAKLAQGDTRFVAQVMRRRDWQQALKKVMGEEAWAQWNYQALLEQFMRRNENAVMAGSKTARTTEDISDLTQETELGFMRDALQSGDLRGAFWRRLLGAWDRWAQGGIRNPEVNRALSRRLFQTSTEGNVSGLVNEINALPGYARVGDLGVPASEVAGQAGSAYWSQELNRPRGRNAERR